MKTPIQTVRTTITLASAAYGGVLYVAGVKLGAEATQIAAYLPMALGFLAVAFDKWIWRWSFVLPWIGRPLVRGAWLVTIRPSAKSQIPSRGNRGPIEGGLIIEQSYFSLHLTQYTSESTSQSSVATIRRVADSENQTVLTSAYVNNAKQQHRSRSPAHDGGSELQIVGHEPKELRGSYWTSRLTAGDMELTLVTREINFSSLEQIQAAANALAK